MLTWLSSAWGSDSGAVVPVQPVLLWCELVSEVPWCWWSTLWCCRKRARGGMDTVDLSFLKSSFFPICFLPLLKQMRALKSLQIDTLKIFGNTGGACVFLCLSVENCPDGKITASWKLFFSVMSQLNTNLYLIQSNLSWKAPTAVCAWNWFQWFCSAAYLNFKTHPPVNLDCIILLFVHTSISSHFMSEINITAFATPLTI